MEIECVKRDAFKSSKSNNISSAVFYLLMLQMRELGIGTTAPTKKLEVVGDATVSGNLSVGGTISYEDVNNIDSVGAITAQSGIQVLVVD